MILTDADELRKALRLAQKERDEARDEVETLRAAIDGEPWGGAVLKRQRDEAVKRLGVTLEQLWTAEKERDEARAEVERLERLFQQTHGVHHTWVDARHKVAERQRTACAEAVGGLRVIFGDEWNGAIKRAKAVVRATPLVTDTKADGGSP